MADALSDKAGATPPTPAVEPAPFFRPTQLEILAHQRRFGLAYFVLAIGVGVAVGLAIVLIGRGSHNAANKAAAFTPERSGELGAREIAFHVQREYRLPSGRELVGIVAQRPQFQNIAMNNDLIRPTDAQSPKDVAVLPLGNGMMFLMCGLGSSCAIDQGKDSGKRNLLLEQEVLELAVRTFQNDTALDTVTALLPPVSSTRLAAVFRRRDLGTLINRPLSSIFPTRGPFRPGSVGRGTEATIKQFVNPVLYSYQAQSGPDGTPILILDPFNQFG